MVFCFNIQFQNFQKSKIKLKKGPLIFQKKTAIRGTLIKKLYKTDPKKPPSPPQELDGGAQSAPNLKYSIKNYIVGQVLQKYTICYIGGSIFLNKFGNPIQNVDMTYFSELFGLKITAGNLRTIYTTELGRHKDQVLLIQFYHLPVAVCSVL